MIKPDKLKEVLVKGYYDKEGYIIKSEDIFWE